MNKLLLTATAAAAFFTATAATPDPGVWYKLQSNATNRVGRVVELVREGSSLFGQIPADKGIAVNRLWSNYNCTYQSDPEWDYQLWRFEEDASNPGVYAMICKAEPDGSVDPTPTAQDATGRFNYDTSARHYNFTLNDDYTYTGRDGMFFAIRSDKMNPGYYFNLAQAGNGYSINCYNQPLDGPGGLFFFVATEEYTGGQTTPDDNAEKIADIQQRIDAAKAEMDLYKKSIPFASENIDKVTAVFDQYTMEELLSYYEQIDLVFEMFIYGPLKQAILQSLEENMSKPWTLYQPVQPGYLSSNTISTKKGWKSFNYQSEITPKAAWTLVPASNGQFYLRSAENQWIGTPEQHYCQALDEKPTGTNGLFKFELADGYLFFSSVAINGCALGLDCKNDPVEIMKIDDASKGTRWQVALFDSNVDTEKIDAITERVNSTVALLERYKQSVPFIASNIDELFTFFNRYSPEDLLPLYDQLDMLIDSQIIDPVEQMALNALKENMSKPWTLYQPTQPGYLTAETVRTNQGWSSFNYQETDGPDAAWQLVPGEKEGEFYFRSAVGQWIGTPKQHYCQALNTKPVTGTNGLFRFAVKDGYVNFESVAIEGCGLGLDCQNDPAEILSLTDGSNGYRWQVALADVAAPVATTVTVTPGDGTTVDELLEITIAIDGGECFPDPEAAAITLDFNGSALSAYTPQEVALSWDAENKVYTFLAEQTTDGTYTLTIPEGFFSCLQRYNEATTISWKVDKTTGIATIVADPSATEVYDLQGRRVNQPANGVYIVNGVKTLIRK